MITIGRKRVHVTGRDGIGWSIDHDRKSAERYLADSGMKVVGSPFTASVIHSVWWRTLFGKKGRAIRAYARLTRQKIVATITNEFSIDDPEFIQAKEFVDVWTAGNYKQVNQVKNEGVKIFWQPFYVDENIFGATGKTKQEICDDLGIDYDAIKDRYLISNFQRDTSGADLRLPKEQKDPAKLIRILAGLPHKDEWLLLLTGPRRHFVISECKRLGIPYFFVGEEPTPDVDDIHTGVQPEHRMALLNELADCSLTTSAWEGGPKAILEGAYANSFVLTTPVGNAPDILPEECLFESDEEAISKLNLLVENRTSPETSEKVEKIRAHVLELCGYQATLNRWRDVYAEL